MTLDALIMFAGALVALLPFLGFPNSWDKIILLALGIIIVTLGIMVRRRGKGVVARPPVRESRTFVEHAPDHSHDAS